MSHLLERGFKLVLLFVSLPSLKGAKTRKGSSQQQETRQRVQNVNGGRASAAQELIPELSPTPVSWGHKKQSTCATCWAMSCPQQRGEGPEAHSRVGLKPPMGGVGPSVPWGPGHSLQGPHPSGRENNLTPLLLPVCSLWVEIILLVSY